MFYYYSLDFNANAIGSPCSHVSLLAEVFSHLPDITFITQIL